MFEDYGTWTDRLLFRSEKVDYWGRRDEPLFRRTVTTFGAFDVLALDLFGGTKQTYYVASNATTSVQNDGNDEYCKPQAASGRCKSPVPAWI
jgi:hypothetical protein